MDLILWRHAEAEPGDPDLGRKLSPKGEKQARRMAEWLHSRLPEATRVLVSPALRAQQTAAPLVTLGGRKVKTIEALAPGASVQALLDAADWPRAKCPVLIVGHQPVLGETAAQLLSGQAAPWTVKKAGIWWFSAIKRDTPGEVVLRVVMSADLL